MTLVSVVVPLYNKEQYIESCILSILHQSYDHFELLVIDDGSTDNGLNRISAISDPRMRVVRQDNLGPGAARNNGILQARGKYITFLDADDQWDPDFLVTAVTVLNRNEDCDIFLCGSEWQPLGQVRLPLFPHEQIDAVRSGPWILPMESKAERTHFAMNLFAMGTVVLRAHLPKLYGGFFSRNRCTSGEDAYLWIQILLNHKVYRYMKSMVHINTHGSQLGIGRNEIKPIPPSLMHPEHLRSNCPRGRQKALEDLLDLIAFNALRRELYKLNLCSAFYLYKKFPNLVHHKPLDFPPFPSAFWTIPFLKIKKTLTLIISR